MIIGFGTGDFCRIYSNPNERFSNKYINHYKSRGLANAIELDCLNEVMIDYLLDITNLNLSYFTFISLHTPDLAYANDEDSNRVLSKLELLAKKYKINNFVFHTDKVLDWNIFNNYKNIPISIENMDDHKKFGKTIDDLKSILDKYNFKLTLDLQHCFVNDRSMKLASDFQEEFKDKIVEYHISGFDDEVLHYPLFKTKQNEIIDSLKNKNIPIIIESTFDQVGGQEKELEYIKNRIN